MTLSDACPVFWISLTADQARILQPDSLTVRRWRCPLCDEWHAEWHFNDQRSQALICSYDCQAASWLKLTIQQDLQTHLSCWWLCSRCQSWHLKLLNVAQGEIQCLDIPTP